MFTKRRSGLRYGELQRISSNFISVYGLEKMSRSSLPSTDAALGVAQNGIGYMSVWRMTSWKSNDMTGLEGVFFTQCIYHSRSKMSLHLWTNFSKISMNQSVESVDATGKRKLFAILFAPGCLKL